MKLITLHLPPRFVRELDKLVRDGRYPNRSEAIRVAVRDLLREEVWISQKAE
ncbi:MAG: type II toxin-antitoxin system ParD family antitoxin [Candidatus Korarchaeota archaeon]|nr:type II toxin-antitoxin system ParD family antitoxin [Candidatus Korarchaeota archaeon]NIU85513.1 ribbon-helix-helix protein, CopG family [Candidatus Thorarchaeota archaeon]NIW15630.1 ribbon-helix-helix protein, CopG family [Candidatus Thorarchaeota archaeon]NIW53561.1 ribbon-helix-helix protein, CopG family [Candidatus Korarchaeota archaeon]